jgi:hypothetical protein
MTEEKVIDELNKLIAIAIEDNINYPVRSILEIRDLVRDSGDNVTNEDNMARFKVFNAEIPELKKRFNKGLKLVNLLVNRGKTIDTVIKMKILCEDGLLHIKELSAIFDKLLV